MAKPFVLFVCLGNICRSPLAEAAFRAAAARIGLEAEVDSAGTGGWHAGEPPDRRAQAVALKNGVDISGYRARKVVPEDFYRFTHILALDHDNLADLKRLAPRDGTAELCLLLDYLPGREGQAVEDPWYGPASGFEITWAEVSAAAEHLAKKLQELP